MVVEQVVRCDWCGEILTPEDYVGRFTILREANHGTYDTWIWEPPMIRADDPPKATYGAKIHYCADCLASGAGQEFPPINKFLEEGA
jgi:hypothetical protein